MKERPLTFNKSWSTHIPMLLKYVQMTDGAVLEIGGGLYSTPLLHWLCAEKKRKLVTVETDPDYTSICKRYQSRTHKITSKIKGLEKLHWSIVFIDGDTNDRSKYAEMFKDSANYVIIHDTNEDDSVYGYERIFKFFKYRFDWTYATPFTTVLSNTKKL